MNSLRYIKKVTGDRDDLAENAAKLRIHEDSNANESDAVEEDATPHANASSGRKNAFDMLLTSDEDDDTGDVSANGIAAKSGKAEANRTENAAVNSKKKRNRKPKTTSQQNEQKASAATERTEKRIQPKDMDEEQLLNYYADQRSSMSSGNFEIEKGAGDFVALSVAERLARFPLIRVDAQYLSGDEELREIMPVLDMEQVASGSGNVGRTRGPGGAVGSRKNRPSFKFIRPDSSTAYPPLAGVGLAMTLERSDLRTGEKTFSYKRNEKYRANQAEFLERQVNMDIEGLFHLYVQAPYNIDNLITIAEFHRMQEEPETGRRKLQTALYALESFAHNKFSYTDGLCRLEYHIPANRSYMLTVFEYMLQMARKNCYKTALECGKHLLNVNADDPLALLMLIDYYALMSDSCETLVQFYACFEQERRLDMMPNFCYSLALAFFMKASQLSERLSEREKAGKKKSAGKTNNDATKSKTDDEVTIRNSRQKATAQLEQALIKFPHVAMNILKSSEFPVIPFIRDHEYFSNKDDGRTVRPALFYLNTLTAVRTSKLWTDDPIVISWLVDTLEKTLRKYDALKIEKNSTQFTNFVTLRTQAEQMYAGLQVPVNLYRHVFLCGLATNSDLQLPAFTRVLSLGVARFDPIPPEDTINRDECDLMAVIRRQAQRRLEDRRRQAANEPAAAGGRAAAGVAGGIMAEFNVALDYLRHMLPGTGNDDLDEHEMHALLDNLQQQQRARVNINAAAGGAAAAAAPVAAARREDAGEGAAGAASEGLYNAGRALRDALGNLFQQVGIGSTSTAAGAPAAAESAGTNSVINNSDSAAHPHDAGGVDDVARRSGNNTSDENELD